MTQINANTVQSTYDILAEEYARRIYDELQHKPFDRDLLNRFAASIREGGLVCDLGCGPGQVARYLYDRGLRACGLDVSEGMLACARRLNPGIEFAQGDMRALPVPNDSWAAITAFYAIVNLHPSDVAKAICEMQRVLEPKGKLLLSFHIGEDDLAVEENVWGSGIPLEATLYRVSTIAGYIRDAGLVIDEIVERDPYAPQVEYPSRRAYIFATKLKS